MTKKIEGGFYQGDALALSRELPGDSIHCIITSPPYFGLRDYGLPPTVWGGRPDCDHAWGEDRHGQFCQHCAAWRGNLGLEPDPDLYIAHLVEVFHELRRVLHPTGVLWLNMGDAYAGSWGNYGARKGNQRSRVADRWHRPAYEDERSGWDGLPPTAHVPGLKPKDLIGLPWRTALALQSDGWWLRSAIPWLKPNGLPESVGDRPTTAHEYWFMLTKSARYFWDPDAIRMPLTEASITRINQPTFDTQTGGEKDYGKNGVNRNRSSRQALEGLDNSQHDGRNYRTTDLFNASLDALIAAAEAYAAHLRQVRDNGGLLLAPDGDPLTLSFPTKGFKGARLLADYFDFEGRPYTLNPDCPLHGGLPNDASPEQAAFWRFAKTYPGDLEAAYPAYLAAYPAYLAAYPAYLAARPEYCTCQPVAVDHFATFPAALVEPLLLSSTSAKGVCPHCGSPWQRVVEKEFIPQPDISTERNVRPQGTDGTRKYIGTPRGTNRITTRGWRPTCTCGYPADLRPDDLEIIASPTGERSAADPSLITGRAGFNRPREENEGRRPLTRYEQRHYASQLKASPHRAAMEQEAGPAFAHYIRTDRSGARPVPPDLLESWMDRGWVERAPTPPYPHPSAPTPAVVLDPFVGSGTVLEVAIKHNRHGLGFDLNKDYLEMARQRTKAIQPHLPLMEAA